MPPDSISQLCVSFYDNEVVENASKVLFELCGSANRADRYRRRQGERKKLETLRDIMALIQRQINDLPVTFVALDLSNLPPVSFDNIYVLRAAIQDGANETGGRSHISMTCH